MDLEDPSGASGGGLAGFCASLKRLQEASGISQAGLLGAAHLEKSQVSAILNGKIKRIPDWDVVIAIVRACLEYAEAKSRPLPRDLRDAGNWRQRYAKLVNEGAQVRPEGRGGVLPGLLLADVTDPFALEVHRPVQPDAPQPGLAALPAYVAREHDAELEQVVTAAARGGSGIAVLVGGSSTGKTRACWEALRLLRDLPKPWRLWHPIDPSRPEAALRELPSIGPRTVVWLNEAQFYLDKPAGGLGERVAAGLRELLRDTARAPVLVLATLWPQHWDVLTARPAAVTDDPHAQARELLAGRDISVPAAFTADQLRQLPAAGDPRLARAAEAAEAGQVIQFLAGAPELMARYRNAPPASAALIRAAMDARRLGMGVALPLAFLEEAAPGYLTDTDWDALGEDWLQQALAYTAAPSKGIRGPLARIRPRPDDAGLASGPAYRLADYLEQHGRRDRRALLPPLGFWGAAARFADPADLSALAWAAENRGLLRDSARLRRHAVARGSTSEAAVLFQLWCTLHPPTADQRPAEWAAAHCAVDDPGGVAQLLSALRQAGAEDQAAALLARDPAAHTNLDSQDGVAQLLSALRQAGAEDQAAALLARAANQIPLGEPEGVSRLLGTLREAGAEEQVTALLARDPAAHAPLSNPDGVGQLLDALREAGADDQVTALLARDPAAHAPLDDAEGIARLLGALQDAGADDQVTALLARDPAAHSTLSRPVGVGHLLGALRGVGADDQAAALAARAADLVSLGDPDGILIHLLVTRLEAGEVDQVVTLAARAADLVSLDDPDVIAWLLDVLLEVGANDQVTVLLARDPAAHAPLDDPQGIAALLSVLRAAGAKEQIVALLARDPAAHTALDNPTGLAWLLITLRAAGADDQAAALAARAADQFSLSDPAGVAWLLDALLEVDADDQAAALLARDPAAHTSLDNLEGVARLLGALRWARAVDHVVALAARAAKGTVLDDDWGVARLLDALREVGADQQAATLTDRLPAEGWFALFCRQPGHAMRYRFGRELDGNPAPSWGWNDLD